MAVISPQEQPRVTVQVPVPTPVPTQQYAPAFQQPSQQQVAQQTQVAANPAYTQAFAPQPQPMPVQQQPTPQPVAQEPEEQDYFTPKKYSGPVAFIFPHSGQSRPKYRPRKMQRFAEALKRLACGETPVRKSMSDMAAFHEGMLAKPNDSLRPLVYADWLDENNKPMAARAIRAHNEVNQSPIYMVHGKIQGAEPGGFRVALAPRVQSKGFDVFVNHGPLTDESKVFRWHAPGEYFDGMSPEEVGKSFEDEGASVNWPLFKTLTKTRKGGEAS